MTLIFLLARMGGIIRTSSCRVVKDGSKTRHSDALTMGEIGDPMEVGN